MALKSGERYFLELKPGFDLVSFLQQKRQPIEYQ